MHSLGFVDLDAPHAVFPTFAGRSGCARCQLWQLHVCSWFCWYLRTRCVPDDCRQEVATLVVNNSSGTFFFLFCLRSCTSRCILEVGWPRSSSTAVVALFSWFCLSSCTSRCVHEVCRQDVATLVVNGSGTILQGFACLLAPRLRSRRLPADAVVASCHRFWTS